MPQVISSLTHSEYAEAIQKHVQLVGNQKIDPRGGPAATRAMMFGNFIRTMIMVGVRSTEKIELLEPLMPGRPSIGLVQVPTRKPSNLAPGSYIGAGAGKKKRPKRPQKKNSNVK